MRNGEQGPPYRSSSERPLPTVRPTIRAERQVDAFCPACDHCRPLIPGRAAGSGFGSRLAIDWPVARPVQTTVRIMESGRITGRNEQPNRVKQLRGSYSRPRIYLG